MRIYIRGLKEKPKSCEECPCENDTICQALDDIKGECRQNEIPLTELSTRDDCPLEVEYQPNPYDSVVALLRDFDIDDEEVIRDLADYICIMFKRGPYDSTEVKP